MTLNEALYVLLIISELVLLAWMSFYILSLIFSWLKGAPYVASRSDELDDIFKELDLEKGQKFLELGCGDGRVTRSAVAQYKVRGIGVDINPLLIWKATFLSKLKKLVEIKFKVGNVLDTNVSDADIIYIYLFPQLVEKLEKKLLDNTKPGALIVGHGFKIAYLEKYLIKEIQGIQFKTYIYRL